MGGGGDDHSGREWGCSGMAGWDGAAAGGRGGRLGVGGGGGAGRTYLTLQTLRQQSSVVKSAHHLSIYLSISI